MERDPVVRGTGRLPLVGLLLTLAVLALFLSSLSNGFVNYDDDTYVTGNLHLRQGLGLGGIGWAFGSSMASNWHPLTWLSHMLDYQVFGLRAWGHHLGNVLLHTLNAVLLFLLCRRLTGAAWKSLVVALFFGLHPLHVQSVAWVSERKDVLSACFFLLSLLAYARHAQETSRRSGRLSLYYGGALLLFALGLMAKPMLVTLPFVLLLLDYWPLGRWQSGQIRKLLFEKLPFALVSVASCVVTFFVQRAGGGMADLRQFSVAGRVENALVSYLRYLGKTFWPADLAVLYPFVPRWPLWMVLGSGLFVVAVSAAALALRRQRPYLLVGWLWVVGMLVPGIGLVHVGQQSMADRYMYLPLVGLLLVIVWGLVDLAGESRQRLRVLSVATVVAAIACLDITGREIGYWRDSESLFRRDIEVTGGTATAHYKLGLALNDRGQLDEAYQSFHKSLELSPGDFPALLALGVVCNRRGEADEAMRWLEVALKQNPGSADGHYQLGVALDRQGQLDEAIDQYGQALRSDPTLVDAHLGAGAALGQKGRFDEAIRQFQAALAIDPENAGAHYNSGLAHTGAGQWEAARASFEKALALAPGNADAHNNLGLVLLRTGQRAEAINEFREALRLRPDHNRARSNLAATQQAEGPSPAGVQ